MTSADPLQLEMFLSKSSHISSGRKGLYGTKCEDYISLTYTLIHSVRSVTLLKIRQKCQELDKNNRQIDKSSCQNSDVAKEYTYNKEAQEFGVSISCDVSESILCIVNAYAHCVVLPVLAGTLQWHLLRLLHLHERDTTSTTTSLSADNNSSRSVFSSSGTSRWANKKNNTQHRLLFFIYYTIFCQFISLLYWRSSHSILSYITISLFLLLSS